MTLIFKKLKLFKIQDSKVLYLSALIADGPLREVLKFCIFSLSKVTRAQRRADDVSQFPFGNYDALTQKFELI